MSAPPVAEITELFAENVREVMLLKGIGQRQMARDLPIGLSHLSRILCGRGTTTLATAQKIASYLNTPLSKLLE